MPGKRVRASTQMPHWASRLTLDVTDVRVQRLQDISEEDAVAEGVMNTLLADGSPCWTPPTGPSVGVPTATARWEFSDLWRLIHGDAAWVANPWVAALTFAVRHGNIDAPVAEREAPDA